MTHIGNCIKLYNYYDFLVNNSFLYCIRIIKIIYFFPYRWQARKEGDRNMRAGLIPSRALQERKIIHERLSATDQKKKCKLKLYLNK